MRISTTPPLALAALALVLSGCELRSDAEDQAPAEAAPAETTGSPAPVGTETPVASIIREDALPGGPIAEPPPEPLERVVPFAEGGSDLSERAERVLAGILESGAIEQDWPIVLRGHTDSDGNDRANLRASRARAEAVAAWLVEHGVDDARIEVIALGEQNPIAPNALPDGSPNEKGRARNRRVEVEIAPSERAEAPGQRGGGAGAAGADEGA